MTTRGKPKKRFGKHTSSTKNPGLRHGFRSGLEDKTAQLLESWGVPVAFESIAIPYVTPATLHTYRPDFPLPNGIIVETKGIFELADRKKHLLVKAQHPKLDIRFVFTNPNSRLYKGSPTTYADWCDRVGFQWAKKEIPRAWVDEPGPGKIIITPESKLPAHTKPTRSTPSAKRKPKK